MINIRLQVNGLDTRRELPDHTLLVDLLRDELGLTGTHVGCDTTQCGACTVQVNGLALKSCTVLAAQISGAQVTTLEGLAQGGVLHPVQQAFADCHALQCGFCTPGMIMAIAAFLRERPADLFDETLHTALEGNICRCTGYVNILKAARQAALQLYPDLAAQGAGQS